MNRKKYYQENREKILEYNRKRFKNNQKEIQDSRKPYQKLWAQLNKEKVKLYWTKTNKKRKDSGKQKRYDSRSYKELIKNKICTSCKKRKSLNNKTTCKICRKIKNETSKERRFKTKLQVIDLYGGRCTCCGEKEIAFLTIDHINNDGFKDRKRKHVDFIRTLKNKPIREDLQVLCWNCNLGKHVNGGKCPHKNIESVIKGVTLDMEKDDA